VPQGHNGVDELGPYEVDCRAPYDKYTYVCLCPSDTTRYTSRKPRDCATLVAMRDILSRERDFLLV